MKKALKITGIVFGILLIVGAITWIILGAVTLGNLETLAKGSVTVPKDSSDYALAVATATSVYGVYGTMFLILGIVCIPGAVLSFLLAKFSGDEYPSKAKFITMGIFAIVTGAEVPGIIAIVHGAKNGN